MVDIHRGFWAPRNGKYRPVLQVFPPNSAIGRSKSGRYGRISAPRHRQHWFHISTGTTPFEVMYVRKPPFLIWFQGGGSGLRIERMT